MLQQKLDALFVQLDNLVTIEWERADDMRGIPNDIDRQRGYASGAEFIVDFVKRELEELVVEDSLQAASDKVIKIQQELIGVQKKVIDMQTQLLPIKKCKYYSCNND